MTPYWDQETDNAAEATPPLYWEDNEDMCFGSSSDDRPRDPPARHVQSNYYDNRTNPYTYHGMATTLGSGRIYADYLNYPAEGRQHESLFVKHPLVGADCHRLRVNELREILAQLYEIRASRVTNQQLSEREDEARSTSIDVVERYLEREAWRRQNDPY